MKVAVIGCGGISHFHVDGFKAAGCEFAWFCDIKAEAAQAYADQYPGSKVTTDYKEVLADPEVKLIAVTSLTSTHNEIVKAAIEAGKGVICEKTLGMNGADALDMCLCAEKNKGFLVTSYMKRFFPAVKKAKELLEGRQIVSVYAKSYQPSPGLYLDAGNPGYKAFGDYLRDYYGGGVLVCGGSHIMDQIHFFCGVPTACCGKLDILPGTSFDRDANAMFFFENGAVAHFEAYWHEYRRGGFEQNGWDEETVINCTDCVVTVKTPLWHKPEYNAARVSFMDAVSGEYQEFRYEAENAFTLHSIDEVKRFENGEAPAVDGWDGYIADMMIDAVKESSEKGEIVKINYDKAMPVK